MSNRLQKLFGVSRIKIDPQGLTTETNPTARGPQVTIEQQFANNFPYLQHQRFAELAADHPGRVLHQPQSLGRGHARSERRRQLRRANPPAQEIESPSGLSEARMNSRIESAIFSTLRQQHGRDSQLSGRGISDERVLDAMGRVPRHEFAPEQFREQAYEDHPLPIGEGQTISQPYIVALMLEALGLLRPTKSGDRDWFGVRHGLARRVDGAGDFD